MERLSRRTALKAAVASATIGSGSAALSACSSPSNPGESPGDSSVKYPNQLPFTSVKADFPVTEAGAIAGFSAYPANPARTIEGKPGMGDPVRALTYTFSPPPPGPDKNRYWQALNDRLGTELSITMAPNADYLSRFTTTIAGGDIPDIVGLRTRPVAPPNLPSLARSVFQDLTEFLSGDAVKDYPFLANFEQRSWLGSAFGSGIFLVPVVRPAVGNFAFIRRDIVQSLGLNSQPTSFAELVDLCRGLTDPRRNRWAQDDPLNVVGFVQQMLGVPNGWRQEQGRFTAGLEMEQTRQAISEVRTMIADGLFHPDSFAGKGGDRFTSGWSCMTYGGYRAWGQMTVPDPPRNIGVVIEPGHDGGRGHHWAGPPSIGFVGLRKANPDRIRQVLSVLNYLAAPFGTAEYLFLKYGLPDVHHKLSGTDPIPTDTGTLELTLPDEYLCDAPQVIYQPGDPDFTKAQYEAQVAAVTQLLGSDDEGLISDTHAKKIGTLQRLIKDAQNEVLQGRKKLSDWDDAVARWRTEGGDQIRTELEQAYEDLHS